MTRTFGSTVDQRFQALWVLWINHADQCGVDPAASLDTIETTNNNLELHVVILILILNFANVGRDFDSLDSLLDKSSGNLCFRLAYVSLTKKKLSVEIRNVNSVWFSQLEFSSAVMQATRTYPYQ